MHNRDDLNRILGRERLADLIAGLAHPDETTLQPSPLTHTERVSLARGITATAHPLKGVALGLLDDWEQLPAVDQATGLLPFATIGRNPGHPRVRTRPPLGRRLEPGL